MYSGSGSFPAEEMKYLKLLSNQYKNINSAATEIINLKAILNLPKGTEHFVSDIHGEADSFSHVLRNASGVIKNQISAIFGESLRSSEKKSLATLIYYPEQKLEKMTETEEEMAEWYKITLHRLVKNLQGGILEIYPFQGEKGTAEGICLYHRGAAARKQCQRG